MTPLHYLLFAAVLFLIFYVGKSSIEYVANQIKVNGIGRSEKVLIGFALIAAIIIVLSMIARSTPS